jgi:hypothetical protein
LAANSERVEKIEQDHFVLCPRQGQNPVKILLPLDCLCHKYPPFDEMKLISQHIISTNGIVQSQYKERRLFSDLKSEIPHLHFFFKNTSGIWAGKWGKSRIF